MLNKSTHIVQLVFSVLVLLIVVSCKKSIPQSGMPDEIPQMEYIQLHNREVKSNTSGFSFDVNHDGRKDMAFKTLLVGDPLSHQDKLQFIISTNIETYLPVNSSEEIPVLNKGAMIMPGHFNGYNWFQLATVVLMEKIISINLPPVWHGHWINSVHKYLPFQIIVNGKRYNGWVELSADITGEKIVLHNAAISNVPDKTVIVGE